MANVKVAILEKDGTEYEVPVEYNYVAADMDFNNTTNGFNATKVQPAIEEARNSAEGFPRAGCRSVYNGSLSNNQWMGPTELLPNTPLLVLPVNTKLNEITWANSATNNGFSIQFYKNGKLAANLFYTMTVTSPNPGYGYISGLTFTFNAGDVIYAKYIDQGTNLSDADLVLWVSRIV